MALYDVPIHSGYKILTHTSTRRYATNGFAQVGNTMVPKNPINPTPVRASAIFNKNLSGIGEAGYGRRYPNYGLSGRGDPGGWGLVSGLRYSGAGSPRTSLAYSGAGSPRSSLAYAGAGSPRSSLRYSGAGSPRTSLRDAYINDNPAPGTLGKVGIPGRRNSIRGLADDATGISPESDFGAVLPADTTPGIFGTIGNVFSSIFGTAVSATEQAGAAAVTGAITGSLTPVNTVHPSPVSSTLSKTGTLNVLGMAIPTTALLLGGGVMAYFALRK